jgi:hypothetical protein
MIPQGDLDHQSLANYLGWVYTAPALLPFQLLARHVWFDVAPKPLGAARGRKELVHWSS